MSWILDLYREKHCRVVRLKGNNPDLVIFGEEHLLNIRATPEPLFCKLKPKYFFCEGISSGLKLNYAQFKAMDTSPNQDLPADAFEKFVHAAYHDIGLGCSGLAITAWFAKSPDTVFVGMDLPDKGCWSDRIAKKMDNAVEKLDGDLAELLAGSQELRDEQYSACNALRDYLYKFKDGHFNNAYSGRTELENILKNISPAIRSKLHVKKLFSRPWQETDNLNAAREKTMARTMVRYVPASGGFNIAVVGAYHIRKSSHLFPILDKASIRYAAIDILDYD